MKLLFVRHAETDWNKANRFQGIVDRNLNENGKKQAKLLSDYLYEKIPGINKIYTSPLSRTKDTALAVGKRFNLKVNEMDSLKEYSVGIFSGKNIDDINYSEDKEIYDNFMIDNNWDLVPEAEKFQIWQCLTYLFLHGSFMHLFFNMLGLWFLVRDLENIWGNDKFLKYK